MPSKEAAALLEELLPFYDRLAQQTDNEAGLRERTAEANRRVAAIRQRLGQFDQAVRANQQAITIFEELGARLSSPGAYQLEIANIQNELGRTYQSQRRLSEARQCYLAALQILPSASHDSPMEVRYELARTYYLLGTRERPLPDSNPPGRGPGDAGRGDSGPRPPAPPGPAPASDGCPP